MKPPMMWKLIISSSLFLWFWKFNPERGVCMSVCVSTPGKVREQVPGICSLLPRGVEKSEGHEAWQQVPLPTLSSWLPH